jgi:hypothetical protein
MPVRCSEPQLQKYHATAIDASPVSGVIPVMRQSQTPQAARLP